MNWNFRIFLIVLLWAALPKAAQGESTKPGGLGSSRLDSLASVVFPAKNQMSMDSVRMDADLKGRLDRSCRDIPVGKAVPRARIYKDDSLLGQIYMWKEKAKPDTVEMAICIDQSGSVRNVAILSYKGPQEGQIKSQRFLNQFKGKSGKSPLTVNRDINAVTGATISSRVTAIGVKKMLCLWKGLEGG